MTHVLREPVDAAAIPTWCRRLAADLDSADARAIALARARGHDINRVRFRSPFLPLLRFTVGTGLQVITRHNHRHLGQAERVRQSPEFPR